MGTNTRINDSRRNGRIWNKKRCEYYRRSRIETTRAGLWAYLIKIDHPIKGAVHSECVNPLWNDVSKCSNRSGETAYGALRSNVTAMVDHHDYKSSDKVE